MIARPFRIPFSAALLGLATLSAAVQAKPPATGASVTVSIGTPIPGANRVDAGFAGLSMERSALVSGLIASSNVPTVNLLRSLGPSVLRIGGNSVNQTSWDDSGAGGKAGFVAPADIDRLAAFLDASGWKVIYGMNFVTATQDQMAREAAYVAGRLGSGLIAFEPGNEPGAYVQYGYRPPGYRYQEFLAEWKADVDAIRLSVSAAAFAGPSAAADPTKYTLPFARDIGSALYLLTHHYYIGSSCPNPETGYTPSIELMLTPQAVLLSRLRDLATAANDNQIAGGARMDESNTFHSCTDSTGGHGGVSGVSDSFASALWAIDYLFLNARYGMSGVNFHLGGGGAYSPIQFKADVVQAVKPEYYGIWLFSQAVGGRPRVMLETTVSSKPDGLKVNAYALQAADGAQSLVLVNESDSNASVTISNLASGAKSAVTRLLAAPSLGATSGVTVGGASLNVDGSWDRPPQVISKPVSRGKVNVSVPKASALLMELQ